LLSKRAVARALQPGARRVVIPHLLDLAFVRNAHGALGLFGDRPAALIALSLGVAAAVVWLMRDALRRSRWAQIGMGLVLGGAAGNVVDRLVHGWVLDFIAVGRFSIFNVGDIAIAAGLALVATAYLRAPVAA
jgi:signal peptidase II